MTALHIPEYFPLQNVPCSAVWLQHIYLSAWNTVQADPPGRIHPTSIFTCHCTRYSSKSWYLGQHPGAYRTTTLKKNLNLKNFHFSRGRNSLLKHFSLVLLERTLSNHKNTTSISNLCVNIYIYGSSQTPCKCSLIAMANGSIFLKAKNFSKLIFKLHWKDRSQHWV